MTALLTTAVFVGGYLLFWNHARGVVGNSAGYPLLFVLPAFIASFFSGWLVARYTGVPVLPTMWGVPLALLVLMALSPLINEPGH
jgi:hypothetical protein